MDSVVVTGASGLLGAYVSVALSRRRAPFFGWSGTKEVPWAHRVELTDEDAVARAFDEAAPSVVVHCAAMSAASDCARDPDRARAVNVDATARLARSCDAAGARLVLVSTDLVFDGEHAPYDEDAARSPLSVYGRTKADAEDAALAAGDACVVRVSLLFGATVGPRLGFFDQQTRAIERGDAMTLFDDEWRTPLSLASAAEGLLLVAASDARGVLHLAGPERMTRLVMGQRLAATLGRDASTLRAASRTSAAGEPRARDVSLSTRKFCEAFPSWRTGTYEAEIKRAAQIARSAATTFGSGAAPPPLV